MTQEEFKNRYQYNPTTDKLGESGSGSVFKAYDTHRDRWVALKISKVNTDSESIRLKKTVEMAAQLPSHPNIVNYDDCYTFTSFDGEYDFGIQQYYEQGNLLQLLKRGDLSFVQDQHILMQILSGILSFVQKRSILMQILSGIEFLHSHDIIHRNLKPQNILIVKRGEEYIPKITDFGKSIIVSGTPAYASPELLGDRATSENTDLWSFGVIAYQIFVGELPFTSGEHAITSEAGRSELFRQINSGQLPATINTIAKSWQQLIRACLVTDPEKRLKNCNECITVLNREKQENVKQEYASRKIHDENMTSEIPKQEPESKSESSPRPGSEWIRPKNKELWPQPKSKTESKSEPKQPKPQPKPQLEPELKPKPKPKPKSKLKSKLSFVIDSIFLIIAIVAVFSNPSEEEHKAAAKKALIQSREVRDLIKEYSGNVLGDIGKILATGVVLDEVIGLIVDELMERKNYIIFSFSSIPLREKAVIGFGAFGKVWIILDGKKAGEEISWAKYDSVQGFKEGFALVKLNSKYGFIDKTGKEITLCKYDYAESFSSELALVKLNSKYGFIDKTGKEIIPCKYDYAESFSGEFTMVKLNGKGCLINKKGRIIGTAIHKDEIKKHK